MRSQFGKPRISLIVFAAFFQSIEIQPFFDQTLHDGYGVGGGSIGHDGSWDSVSNLRARMSDGVIGITQANPRGDWSGIVSGIRGQLASLPNCTAMTAPVMAMVPAQGGQNPAAGGRGGTQGQGSGGATGNTGGNSSPQAPQEPQAPQDPDPASPADDAKDNEPGQGNEDQMGPPTEDDEKLNEFFGVGCALQGRARSSGIAPLGLALGWLLSIVRRGRRRGSA